MVAMNDLMICILPTGGCSLLGLLVFDPYRLAVSTCTYGAGKFGSYDLS